MVLFNSIKIKGIEVTAEVEFQNVRSGGNGSKISAKLRGGGFGRKGNRAKIKITVEGGDPPEALSKILDMLSKSIMPHKVTPLPEKVSWMILVVLVVMTEVKVKGLLYGV